MALYTYTPAEHSAHRVTSLYRYYRQLDMWFYDEFNYCEAQSIWDVEAKPTWDVSYAQVAGIKRNASAIAAKAHITKRFSLEAFLSEVEWNTLKADLDLQREMSKHMVK